MLIGSAAVEQRERRLALGSAGCACDRGADGEALRFSISTWPMKHRRLSRPTSSGSPQKYSGFQKWR
jgi:hypothetical protein